MKKIVLTTPKKKIEEISVQHICDTDIVVGVGSRFARVVTNIKGRGFTLVDMIMFPVDEKWFPTLQELINNDKNWDWYSFVTLTEFAHAVVENNWR